MSQMNKSDSVDCQHSYRLFNDIEGEWKLIWECVHCGGLFMCKCFQKAMEGKNNASRVLKFQSDHDDQHHSEMKVGSLQEMEKKLARVRYKGMSCEICLDKPSTHHYSKDMTNLDEFQRRYGAYIMKQAIDMVLNGKVLADQNAYLEEAEVMVRLMYGFRDKTDVDVDPSLLPNLMKSLFPEEEILLDHRPDWLSEGCLQVFLPKRNLVIENWDTTHYELLAEDKDDMLRLFRQREKDRKKEESCVANGIDFLVIPYYKELDRDSLLWKVSDMRPALRKD